MARRLAVAGAIGALALPSLAAPAVGEPCAIRSNLQSICLDPAGGLATQAADGYLYVAIGREADYIDAGSDWACGACHRAPRLEPKGYRASVHRSVFRRQAQPIGEGSRLDWAGGWTLLTRAGRLCVARGNGVALGCFPDGAFALRGTARRTLMIDSPGPVESLN